jgi:carbon monoxide dehydrogenase subunit G
VKLFSSIFLLLIATCSFAIKQQAKSEWLLAQEKKGIKIFTKKSSWSKLKDTRAEMVVNHTPEEVIKMLTDVESFMQWMPRCKSAKRLANINDNEFIVRLVFGVPWPLRDRECIMRMKVERMPDGEIVLYQNSEPRYLKGDDGFARIERMNATWKMTPKDGNRTEILNEYSSDAGGNIPDWLVNTQAVENPFQTFSNMRLQLPAITKR